MKASKTYLEMLRRKPEYEFFECESIGLHLVNAVHSGYPKDQFYDNKVYKIGFNKRSNPYYLKKWNET